MLCKGVGGEAQRGARGAAPTSSVVVPPLRLDALGLETTLRHGAARWCSGRKSHRPMRNGVWIEEGPLPLQFSSPPSKEGSVPPSPTAPPPKLQIPCTQSCDPPPSLPAGFSAAPWRGGHGAVTGCERAAGDPGREDMGLASPRTTLPCLAAPGTSRITAPPVARDIWAAAPPPPPHFLLDPELHSQPTLLSLLGGPLSLASWILSGVDIQLAELHALVCALTSLSGHPDSRPQVTSAPV